MASERFLRVQAEAGEIGKQDAQPASSEAGVHDGDDADLNGLGFRLGKAQAHGDEVAGALAVDGEEGGEGQTGVDVAFADFSAHEGSDDLRNDRAGTQKGGQAGDGADHAQSNQTEDIARQRGQDGSEGVAETGAVDDTDQHGNEGHEGQEGRNAGLDGIAGGLIEGVDDLTGGQAQFGDKGLVFLLGQGFGNLRVSGKLGFLLAFGGLGGFRLGGGGASRSVRHCGKPVNMRRLPKKLFQKEKDRLFICRRVPAG